MRLRLAFASGLLAAAFATTAAADDGERLLQLRVGAFDPLVEEAPRVLPETMRVAARGAADSGVLIIQFDQAPDLAIRDQVLADAEILHYLPDNAYMVRAATTGLASLEARRDVRWAGPLTLEMKLEDRVLQAIVDPDPAGEMDVELVLWPGENLLEFEDFLRSIGSTRQARRVSAGDRARYLVRIAPDAVPVLAASPSVEWIEAAPVISQRNNSTRGVIQADAPSLTPIHDRGIRGQGQIIGHLDGRLNLNHCLFRDPVNNTPGPNHRKVLAVYDPLGNDSHGIHTAGTAAGWHFDGRLDHAGIAYEARIVHGDYLLVGNWRDQPLNSNQVTFEAALIRAQADGAFVHTNSWGDDTTTNYTLWARDIDKFSWENPDSLVVLAATNMSSLRTPENSKNVLAVGATSQHPNQNQHATGGVGPTSDGRRKPEIYTPGAGIRSGSPVSSWAGDCGTGTSTGTSMACPAITGAAALARQYFMEGWYPSGAANPEDAFTPTGVLLKAALLNSTVDMTGVAGYPSNLEGWGRLVLDRVLHFEGDALRTFVADNRQADAVAAGEFVEYEIHVEDGGFLAVTMAFMDFPAAHLAATAPVQNIDLRVIHEGGAVYWGNNFQNGSSVSGGRNGDAINNVERVLLPNAPGGRYTIRVVGVSTPIAAQPFAVVATGNLVDAPIEGPPAGWLVY